MCFLYQGNDKLWSSKSASIDGHRTLFNSRPKRHHGQGCVPDGQATTLKGISNDSRAIERLWINFIYTPLGVPEANCPSRDHSITLMPR